jgi:hypothetical protein
MPPMAPKFWFTSSFARGRNNSVPNLCYRKPPITGHAIGTSAMPVRGNSTDEIKPRGPCYRGSGQDNFLFAGRKADRIGIVD